jgi:hypothetical protein
MAMRPKILACHATAGAMTIIIREVTRVAVGTTTISPTASSLSAVSPILPKVGIFSRKCKFSISSIY